MSRTSDESMKLSFVIPAHNEEECLPSTIGAIRESMQGLNNDYEIIVAADGCTDGTVRLASSLGATVVSHDRRQIAATRNLGAHAATGDVLVFVDADTRVNHDAIVQLLDVIRAGAVGGGGPCRLDGPLPLYARLLMPTLNACIRLANLTGGAFLFCTRRAWELVGGFDETYFAAEEIYFARSLRQHGKFRLIRSSVVTSGRKVRTYSAWELLALLGRGITNPSLNKDRSKLDFFYGPRRPDPHRDAGRRDNA